MAGQVDGDQEQLPLQDFSAEEMERIRKLDVQNIRLKAAAGEVLTREQMKRLELAVGEKDGGGDDLLVGSQQELAEALDISDRKSIQRWLKDPTSPGKTADDRYSVSQWREWMERKGKRAGKKLSIDEQRAKAVALDVELKQIELAERRGEVIGRDECLTVLLELVTRVTGDLLQVHHSLAPSVTGVTVPEAGKRINAVVRETLERLAAIPEGAKKKTFWQIVSSELCSHLRNCLSGSTSSKTSGCTTASGLIPT